MKWQSKLIESKTVIFRNLKSDFLSSEGAFFVKKVIEYGNTKLHRKFRAVVPRKKSLPQVFNRVLLSENPKQLLKLDSFN